MAQFTYKARRRSGDLVEGSLDVADRPAAIQQLEKLGLFPVSVAASKGAAPRRAPSGNAPAAASSAGMPTGFHAWFNRRRKPTLQELAMYTQQLANLLKAGMPLTVALHSMTSLSSKGIPAEVSRQLKQDVTEGKSLSDAMSRAGGVFPDLVINIVRAGEQSGAIEEVLRRQAAHFERFFEVQAKFKSAMIYPLIVCSVGVGLVIFFMTVMLPKFLTLFDGMKVPLPRSTQILISISNILSSYWWAIILVGILGYVIFQRYKATPHGRESLDRLKMQVPVVGRVIRLNLFGQFARVLSTLLHNGVPVLGALKITEQIVPNSVVKRAIATTREAVTDGKTLAQPLAQSRIFPPLMIVLIKIGEETGDVPSALNNVAETFEAELNIALRTMTNLIEPIMIIGIAVIVGFLLMSVMSAMFAITNSIQK